MTTGVEIRAQIDADTIKALLLINGGAAVALLALLPYVLTRAHLHYFGKLIMFALLLYQVALLCAVISNRLRRICSLEYEKAGMRPSPCTFFGLTLSGPCVCIRGTVFMWMSVIFFLLAGLTVFAGGITVPVQNDPLVGSASVLG